MLITLATFLRRFLGSPRCILCCTQRQLFRPCFPLFSLTHTQPQRLYCGLSLRLLTWAGQNVHAGSTNSPFIKLSLSDIKDSYYEDRPTCGYICRGNYGHSLELRSGLCPCFGILHSFSLLGCSLLDDSFATRRRGRRRLGT
jgi:hypothetical protein